MERPGGLFAPQAKYSLKDSTPADVEALTDRKNQQLAEQKARFSEWRTMDKAKRKGREAVHKYRGKLALSHHALFRFFMVFENDYSLPFSLRRAAHPSLTAPRALAM